MDLRQPLEEQLHSIASEIPLNSVGKIATNSLLYVPSSGGDHLCGFGRWSHYQSKITVEGGSE